MQTENQARRIVTVIAAEEPTEADALLEDISQRELKVERGINAMKYQNQKEKKRRHKQKKTCRVSSFETPRRPNGNAELREKIWK